MALVPPTGSAALTRRVCLVLALAGLAFGACSNRAAGSPEPAIAASGFPVGTYVKEFVEPQFGPTRIAWTFEPDGRWAEIPLEGAPVGAMPIRGSYAVTGEVLTIATDYPPGFGTSRHVWRVDGTQLWTTFRSSEFAGDAEWFAMLDTAPWVPLR